MHLNKKLKMMPGSDTGNSYLLIGRNGNIALGIKPTAVMKGEAFNTPGTTWFGSKLRSAPAGDLFSDAAQKVVKLQSQPANLWDAWPTVVWEKKNSQRASTTIGILLPGTPDGDAESVKKFVEQISGGGLAKKMAAYIVELIGEQNLVISEAEIAGWFDGHYQTIVEKILAHVAKQKKLTEAIHENVGVFGMQAALLKKVYEGSGKPVPQMTDEDEGPETLH